MKAAVGFLGLSLLLLTANCGSGGGSGQTTRFSGAVSDPAGDADFYTGVAISPDLVSGTIQVTDDDLMHLSVRLAPPTFNASTSLVQFDFDIDQNAGTGVSFLGLGVDYFVDLGTVDNGTMAVVYRYAPGAGFSSVGMAPITFGSISMDVALPLSLFGAADGRSNFRVNVSTRINVGDFTPILDLMPDSDLAPGQVR